MTTEALQRAKEIEKQIEELQDFSNEINGISDAEEVMQVKLSIETKDVHGGNIDIKSGFLLSAKGLEKALLAEIESEIIQLKKELKAL